MLDHESLRADWSILAERSGNLFATWEWADVWWRHYGDGHRQATLRCVGPDDELVALLPLCVQKLGPLRIARFVGYGPADELGPVCAPGDLGRVSEIASEARHPEVAWDVLLAERLPGDVDWPGALSGVELRRDSSPTIDIAGLDWNGYLATRSSNFRGQVRRKERKLLREQGLTYRLCDDEERLDADLDVLFALHGARWGEEGSDAFDSRRQAFHREFAAVALRNGWLRMWLAECDGRPVAAWYGFRFGGSEWYYQFGRDPEWDRYSVGLVLLAHTLREAITDGLDTYRLLRGGESYKDRFATSDVGTVTVAAHNGAVGRVAVAAARGALRLPDSVRQRVTGRIG